MAYNAPVSLRTVIYIRKSSNDKDENHQKLSWPRQKRDIQEFLKRHNHIVPPSERLLIVDEARDIIMEDASAKIPYNRPEFTKMIERVRHRKYDVILCTELSRLSRNAVDTGTLVQLLEAPDKDTPPPLKQIRTVDKVFTITPTDKFTLGLFLMVSKFENDQRAVSTKSGLGHQKEKGITTHRAPMGYRNIGSKKGGKDVVPDEETWDDVRALWEMTMTGDYAVSDIKREGDRRHVTYIKGGKRYTPGESAYRYMFRNRYYTGRVVKRDKEAGEEQWIKTKNSHPAMVTDAEFEKVQLILQSQGYRHQRITATPSIEAILNEILICGKCQTIVNGISRTTKMTFEQKTRYTCARCKHRYSASAPKPCPECEEPVSGRTRKETHRYYHCCKKESSKICSHDFFGTGTSAKNIPAEKVEKFLDEGISRLHISEALFNLLSRQLYTLWLEAHDDLRRKEDALEGQKKALRDERLDYRKKSFKQDTTDAEKEDIDALLDINKQKDEALGEELDGLKEQQEEKFEKSWQTLNALREAKSVLGTEAIGIEPKRRLVLSMVSNLTIDDGNWTINWKKPFDAVANAGIANSRDIGFGKRKGELNYKWLPRLDSNQQPWR